MPPTDQFSLVQSLLLYDRILIQNKLSLPANLFSPKSMYAFTNWVNGTSTDLSFSCSEDNSSHTNISLKDAIYMNPTENIPARVFRRCKIKRTDRNQIQVARMYVRIYKAFTNFIWICWQWNVVPQKFLKSNWCNRFVLIH